MRNFLITAATVTAVAMLASAPAGAAESFGPNKVGNQCFTPSPAFGREMTFGSWGACPQPAAAAVAPKSKKK
jgi:hypothetical protein